MDILKALKTAFEKINIRIDILESALSTYYYFYLLIVGILYITITTIFFKYFNIYNNDFFYIMLGLIIFPIILDYPNINSEHIRISSLLFFINAIRLKYTLADYEDELLVSSLLGVYCLILPELILINIKVDKELKQYNIKTNDYEYNRPFGYRYAAFLSIAIFALPLGVFYLILKKVFVLFN